VSLRVEVLARAHRPLVARFENQHASLVEYLQRYALRHAERDLLSKTYVAIDTNLGRPAIVGYFSLTTTSVQRSSVDSIAALARLPRFPIPGVLLARLAVDARIQRQGHGQYLFEQALGRTLHMQHVVAFRMLVAHAIDEAAAGFYRRRGFVETSEALPRQMVLDLAPLAGPRQW
jgi:GNAT superfamily N-acetyltransferase